MIFCPIDITIPVVHVSLLFAELQRTTEKSPTPSIVTLATEHLFIDGQYQKPIT
jgi:hypothetical protein